MKRPNPLSPWRRNLSAAALTVLLLATAGSALGADPKNDPWHFAVTVPIWAAGIEGDVTAKGRSVDVDVGFDDLWDHLDASFALGLEARKERFGFFGNMGYMKFSADGTGSRGVSEDAELKFLVSDVGVAYRLMKRGEERPFVLEALAGIRYWYVATDMKVKGPRGRVLLDADNSHNLVDPIIGLRASQYVAEKWHLDFQGDIGGFGISDDTSDFDWSAAGLVTYDATRRLGFSAGYRALAVDAERHGGAKKKGVDIIMHGLLLTAQFKF